MVKIDKTKYYSEPITKACNKVMKDLIINKTLKKPKFTHTTYPNDTYKEFLNPENPCHCTTHFSQAEESNEDPDFRSILEQIKSKKKQKNKEQFINKAPSNVTEIYTDGSYTEPLAGSGIYC